MGKKTGKRRGEKSLAIPAKESEFFLVSRRNEKRLDRVNCVFRKMPQLVVWRKAWGREDWEKGIQTDKMLSNKMVTVASSVQSQ